MGGTMTHAHAKRLSNLEQSNRTPIYGGGALAEAPAAAMAHLKAGSMASQLTVSSKRSVAPAHASLPNRDVPSVSSRLSAPSTANSLHPTSARSPVPHGSSRRGGVRPMAAAGATFVGAVTADKDMRFAVVVSRFNSLVTKELLEGAHEVFERHGVKAENVDVAWVPGSFELPLVAKSMAKSGAYNAIVCIGAVIQGATTHYDAVVGGAVSGIMNAGTDSGVPVIFGVLTTGSLEQALDRSGGKVGNKGGEAAFTAIEMASLMKQLRAAGKAAPAAKAQA